MPTQLLTLQVPDVLYHRLKQRAEKANSTVEAAALDALVAAVPVADGLPAEFQEAIAPLSTLDDEALWRAARSHLPRDAAERLEELNLKRQRESLTAAESQAQAELLRQYDLAMLVRAEAAALLHQRGHDVSVLLSRP